MPRRPPARQLLNSFLTEQRAVDAELARVLEQAARESAGQVRKLSLKQGTSVGARVRAAQFISVLSELNRIQNETWTDKIAALLGRSFARIDTALQTSLDDVGLILENAVGTRRAEALLDSFKAQTAAGLRLDRTRRAQALSPRVYRNASLAQGSVERTVRAGIIQGLSARELAANVRSHISPSTPGGVGYAAMRLARTELNNAFHEGQKEIAAAPWVRAAKWNLSGTHSSRVKKPDKCDAMANQNIHDLGKGRYPADDIPDKPHPQCLCFITYEAVSKMESIDLIVETVVAQRTA